ncbi:MAG: ATP-binding cassette domain-containing protein, partial [Campylobacterales bacterium]
MSHYRPFVIAGVLLLLAAAAIVNALYQRELPDNLIAQAGRIDGDLIVLNAKYPGRLTMLNADEGDRVEANATVAQLDDRETLAKIRAADAKIRALESRLEADKLAYKIAKAALPSLYRSAYENIEVAEAALNAAEEQIRRQKLVVEQERKDYERAESLLSQHLIKAHDVELRRLAYESETQGLKTLQQQKRQARQRVRIAKEQTEAAKADVTKIEMAAAQVTADRAQIEAAAAARDELRLCAYLLGWRTRPSHKSPGRAHQCPGGIHPQRGQCQKRPDPADVRRPSQTARTHAADQAGTARDRRHLHRRQRPSARCGPDRKPLRSMHMSRLRVEAVSVRYKKRTALHPVSFEAAGGEIIGLIGADGAGKSSLMHAISGVIRFDGAITYGDHPYRSPSEAEPIKTELGFMPQGLGLILYETLTVGEHLDFFADIRNIRKDDAFRTYKTQLLHMAGLSEFTGRMAGNLSGGMMQKLALICTLIHRPKLLLLDEPTTGVDPLSRMELWEILKQVASEGTLCIVSTAYMAEAEKMDRILLFDEGDLIASGTASELLQNVEPYVYAPSESPIENAITLKEATYSLESLALAHRKPTLDALFFVNRLKKGGAAEPLPALGRSSGHDLPEVIMRSDGLTKRFNGFTANDAVDMTLRRGEILGLLGANGAGKTTFIKMLLGLLPIDEGELSLLGEQIHSARDRRKLKSRLGYVSQHFALYDELSVRENLFYFARMHRIATAE